MDFSIGPVIVSRAKSEFVGLTLDIHSGAAVRVQIQSQVPTAPVR